MKNGPRLRLRAVLLLVAAIAMGLVKAVRVYEVHLSEPSVRVLHRDDQTVTERVSTGTGYLPGVEPLTATLAGVAGAALMAAWHVRRRTSAGAQSGAGGSGSQG